MSQSGYICVYSGASYSLLRKTYGQTSGGQFGYAVSGAGDLDGDGTSDYLAGAHRAGPGTVHAYSGKTHATLWQATGVAARDRFGQCLAGIGDFDSDGRDDVLVGASGVDNGPRTDAGAVYVLSGANGAVLHTVLGNSQAGELGSSVAYVDDVNGDGKLDFAVGAANESPGGINAAGAVYLHSGADGSLLYQLNGQSPRDLLGTSVSPAGDPNGDGIPDFVAGARRSNSGGFTLAGSAFVFSGGRLTLHADTTVIPAASGGQVHLELDLGASGALRPYLIFGSASGTSPGLNFGPVTLPLNPDWFYAGVLQFVNTPLFANFFGYLDGQGKATATFNTIATVPTVYVGTQFHFAALVGSPLDFASNALPIEIMP